MMTILERLGAAAKISILIILTVVMSACTFYPEGVSHLPNYIPFGDCCGVLMQPDAQSPKFVVSNQYGINMLVDERIIGQWSFQEGVNNVVLSSDGTATTTTPSFVTRNGLWSWASGNVIVIMYIEGGYDIMRFDLLDDENAVVTIFSHDSSEPIAFFAVKNGLKGRSL